MGYKDMDKTHTKDVWFKNIILQGSYLNDQTLVKNYVQRSGEVIEKLLNWGLKPTTISGEDALFVTGVHILDVLYRRAKELDVDMISDRIVTDIVTKRGGVAGVISIDVYSGNIFFNPSKAVIIATGGCHGIYEINSGPSELTGDGIAMALRAGVEIKDMEMMEFCNDTITHPKKFRGNILPYVLKLFGYGEILNRNGEKFIHRYFTGELLDAALYTEWNKELVSYAEYKEIKEGRGFREGVIYTMERHREKDFREIYKTFPIIRHSPMDREILQMLKKRERLLVAPAAHYITGGIKVDENYMTNIDGIFAAGECKAGTFGANRVSSALTEMLVEGTLAGEKAAIYTKKHGIETTIPKNYLEERYEEDLLRPFKPPQESRYASFISIKRDLQGTMWRYVGPIKNERTLKRALNEIKHLKNQLNKIHILDDNREYNSEWIRYLNLRNMVLIAGTITKSSIIRRESRGVHIREDHFYVDNKNWLKNIVIYNTSLDYRLETPSITDIAPPAIKMHYLDYIKELLKEVRGAY
jgi:succinate dehydrogenase/fumarate reductase flavoprotein subunit